MKKSFPFSKKAAYLCLFAPFIASATPFLTKQIYSGSGAQQSSGYYFAFTILASGLAFGIYSLINVRKTKGILPPASIGLTLNVLAAIFFYQSYLNCSNDFVYYEINSLMKSEKLEYKQITFGRIKRTKQINSFVDTIKAGLLNACPNCRITDSKIYKDIPLNFTGIFENARFGYTYVAIDTGKSDVGDIRFIFPELDPQPTCRDLSSYIEVQRLKFEQLGTVNCIESMKNNIHTGG